jgi:hypothetical protein
VRSAAGAWWGGLALLAFLLLAFLAHFAIGGGGSGMLRWSVAAASGLPHAAVNGLLLWWFGRTVLSGREPLITRIARRVHGTLTPPIQRYTRHVTIAWCVFFALQLAVSLGLFLFAPLETWSTFVNVLNVPLVVLMFAGEYLLRVVLHPDHPRASIARTVRAFAQDSVSAGAKAP